MYFEGVICYGRLRWFTGGGGRCCGGCSGGGGGLREKAFSRHWIVKERYVKDLGKSNGKLSNMGKIDEIIKEIK